MHRPRLAALVTGTLVAGTLAVGAVSASTQAIDAPAAPEPPLPAVRFQELGSDSTGAADLDDEVTAAEIVAYDDDTMYVMTVGGIDVVDISDPTNPSKQGQIVLPGDPTSVAVDDGLVVVSVPADPRTSQGTVFFFQGSNPARPGHRGCPARHGDLHPGCGAPSWSPTKVSRAATASGLIDPEGSISVIETKDFRKRQALTRPPRERARTISFTDFNVGNRRDRELPAGVRITGPNATVVQDLEPEYITIAENGRTAWVSLQENNALAVLDLRSCRVDRIVALGTSDHSVAGFGFDASDRDGRIDISTRKAKGLYMPDGLANFEVRGKQYVVTANEGDARDYTGFADIGRARSVADTTAIPAAAVDAQLGRLNVITTAPATKNAAGKVTDLYTLGSRSFSIRTAKATGVGQRRRLEQITARTFPGNFNASNSSNDFDGRSDDKGPEPENVVVGKIDGRQYAFVALERIGGIMVYDVTDPTAPVFQQYLTTASSLPPPVASSGRTVGPRVSCSSRPARARPVSPSCCSATR